MSARRGVFAFLLTALVLGLAVVIVAVWMHARPNDGGSPVVLIFEPPRVLDEGAPPASTFPFTLRRGSRLTTWDVVRGLDQAADDDRVRGLVLHIGGLDWGWARTGEVRDAVLRFRRSGKPVYASLTGGGEREYLLASAAGRLSMPPTADLQLDGLVASALFFRGSLDKLGITPNFAHVGRYKSAVEPYTRSGMSPDARVAMAAMLDELYAILLDGVAAGRRLPRDSVARLIDEGPFTAVEARRAGLLDTLLYDTEVDSVALGAGRRGGRHQTFEDYVDGLPDPVTGAHVALVAAEGEIMTGRSRWSPGQDLTLGSETLIEALRQARTRKNVRAIVLRIDSPGGIAQASDDIWREVERCRAAKPVIVSMSDLAASGGYYIAVAADSILSSPATLTGSIGIFGGKLNVLGLYRKLGLNVESVSRGRHAEMLSPYRDFTPEEQRLFEHGMESFYRGFVARVARGRHLREATVDTLAQGRVWTGTAAVRRGLVDRLGGLDAAFAAARARAGIGRDEPLIVERFPRVRRTFLDRMIEDLLDRGDGADALLPPVLRSLALAREFPAGQPLARLPFRLEIR